MAGAAVLCKLAAWVAGRPEVPSHAKQSANTHKTPPAGTAKVQIVTFVDRPP